MRKISAMLLILVLMLGTIGTMGCQHRPANTVPESATVQYERSLLAAADTTAVIATALTSVDEARKAMLANKQIDAETSADVLNFLKRVALKNEAAVQVIHIAQVGGEGAQVDWRKAMRDIMTEAKNLDPTLIGIKSATAQNNLKAALLTLDTSIQLIEAFQLASTPR